jgi:hypothetical protein
LRGITDAKLQWEQVVGGVLQQLPDGIRLVVIGNGDANRHEVRTIDEPL